MSCLSSSAASIIWHGYICRKPYEASLGASGVVMALAAANASFFPHSRIFMFGMELTTLQQQLLFLACDALSQRGIGSVDVSSHVGGWLCGWMAVRWWWPTRRFGGYW